MRFISRFMPIATFQCNRIVGIQNLMPLLKRRGRRCRRGDLGGAPEFASTARNTFAFYERPRRARTPNIFRMSRHGASHFSEGAGRNLRRREQRRRRMKRNLRRQRRLKTRGVRDSVLLRQLKEDAAKENDDVAPGMCSAVDWILEIRKAAIEIVHEAVTSSRKGKLFSSESLKIFENICIYTTKTCVSNI